LIYALAVAIFLDLVLVLALYLSQATALIDFSENFIVPLLVMILIKDLVVSYFAIRYMGRLVRHHHYLEQGTLVEYTGFYSPNEKVYPLKNLMTVEIFTPFFFGPMMKYGSARLQFMQNDTTEEVNLGMIVEPRQLRQYLSQYLSKEVL